MLLVEVCFNMYIYKNGFQEIYLTRFNKIKLVLMGVNGTCFRVDNKNIVLMPLVYSSKGRQRHNMIICYVGIVHLKYFIINKKSPEPT